MKGVKEARWNNKYMKVIEKPVQTIETVANLASIDMCVGVLMKTLENIFENSNFYKEARMVSFLDQLLQSIISKIKNQCNLGNSIRHVVGRNSKLY